ncbi:hypothetical protein Rumeso_02764 [Rubellimicrobium mesophilum DSM 19309]|uniref:DUF1127 domain-containing protein n=1 Tax=Rubellimicrobium mesophilum DSM 19309 TaxID=442562 RepID=A0A017HMF2_9RHOB|nr:hypothetical protein [Rubellimicrobium mesophilum]EYD75677.1 hypothetical protein Rumeso_02764 [Rubellimicrobium mesophilum DSM 19309]
MTTLTASRFLVDGLSPRPSAFERRDGLRALLRRLAAIAQSDTARRSVADLPAHLRRDIGLGDIHVLDL